MRPRGAILSGDTALYAVGDSVYFVAVDGVHGAELWVSGATPANTVRVSETFGDSTTNIGLNVNRYARLGARLYLMASRPDRLWIYDMDADADGLSDQRETELGTHPANSDSDGDTVADGSDAFPTFSCDGVLTSIDVAWRMFDVAQLASLRKLLVNLTVDDTHTAPDNGTCFASRVELIPPK